MNTFINYLYINMKLFLRYKLWENFFFEKNFLLEKIKYGVSYYSCDQNSKIFERVIKLVLTIVKMINFYGLLYLIINFSSIRNMFKIMYFCKKLNLSLILFFVINQLENF